MAVELMNERKAITDWFESDFKQAAMATTKTSRLEDGRLSYSFSVVNSSGFDFDKFSFRIKVIDKTNNRETIPAWTTSYQSGHPCHQNQFEHSLV